MTGDKTMISELKGNKLLKEFCVMRDLAIS